MKKFTVHLCAPVLTWEGVEAETEQEAIDKCPVPQYYDGAEPMTYLVEDVTPEEDEEGEPE